jgi:hypothetical protein
MKTLDELFSPADHDEAVALRAPGRGEQVYTYERFVETVHDTAAVLDEVGVDQESLVAVAAEPTGHPVFGFYAGALLGATVWIGAPRRVNARAVIAPTATVGEYELPGGAARIGFGETPDDDDVMHFERAIWKADADDQTPNVLAGTKVLTDGEREYSHRAVLDAAEEIADRLDPDTTVSVRVGMDDPRTIASAIVAPLLVGGTIRFPETTTEPTGDVAITDDHAPEPRAIPVQRVALE